MIGIAFESCRKIVIGLGVDRQAAAHAVEPRAQVVHRLAEVGAPRERQRTLLEPSWDVELICSSPATALTACSMGRVMSCSISCGPTPG